MHRPLAAGASRLTRRQLAGAASGGALLGSAWAVLFRRAIAGDHQATVTVVRSQSALAALIAWRGHRVAVVDAADVDGAAAALELTTGFLRQRIDAIIAPTQLAESLRRDLLSRWRVQRVWTLPDLPDPSGRGLAGRALVIDRLRIEADALPLGAWSAQAGREQSWFVTVGIGAARMTIVSDGAAIDRLPLDPSIVNVVVCGDVEMQVPARAGTIAALAVASEVAGELRDAGTVVPLATGTPVVFLLRDDGFELPPAI